MDATKTSLEEELTVRRDLGADLHSEFGGGSVSVCYQSLLYTSEHTDLLVYAHHPRN